eukprot:PhM_4_TR18331/c0_g1_i1/m.66849/K00566/mnmA, trmU; tRNA-uridine 2-sulfurtransferase
MKIAVALSGGVDSSVAAFLLKKYIRTPSDVLKYGLLDYTMQTTPLPQQNIQNNNIDNNKSDVKFIGVYMHNWDERDEEKGLTGVRTYCERQVLDARDAEKTAEILKLDDFRVVDFTAEYQRDCFDVMVNAFVNEQRALNVDVLCNVHVKYGALLRHCIDVFGADYLATGHYVRRLSSGMIGTPVQYENEQTYFLSRLCPRRQIPHALFPLGHWTSSKAQVRDIAIHEAGLVHVARKPTSVGLCFVGKRSFAALLEEYSGLESAVRHDPAMKFEITIVDDGEEHHDIAEIVGVSTAHLSNEKRIALLENRREYALTIGEKIHLKYRPKSTNQNQTLVVGRFYVCAKHVRGNVLEGISVCTKFDSPALMATTAIGEAAHWFISRCDDGSYRCYVVCRHHDAPVSCTIKTLPDNAVHVTFDSPRRALLRGQLMVFYQPCGDRNDTPNTWLCVGSAWVA